MRILRYRDLSPRKGIDWSRVQLDREERAGRFPQRVHLGPNSVGWVEAEIDEWLEQRAAQRKSINA